MPARRINSGDRVFVNHKGRTTWATAIEVNRANRTVTIEPDNPRFTWREVPAKEVTEVLSTAWTPAQAIFR